MNSAARASIPLSVKNSLMNCWGRSTELREKSHLILIPDGSLHLAAFLRVWSTTIKYLLQTHEVSVTPSSTVLHILKTRAREQKTNHCRMSEWPRGIKPLIPATSSPAPSRGPNAASLRRFRTAREKCSRLPPHFPSPAPFFWETTPPRLISRACHWTRFNVLHLALHGYADIDYPDRSALVFAPNPSASDDGLLQVRDIRKMHLNAKFVTLSACNTGVGPVGEAGVANLVNAFIEAGAESVVSTLWELEDHSTSRMMTDFYHHVAMHEPEAKALRDAQLRTHQRQRSALLLGELPARRQSRHHSCNSSLWRGF